MTKDTQTRLLKVLADLDAQRKVSDDLSADNSKLREEIRHMERENYLDKSGETDDLRKDINTKRIECNCLRGQVEELQDQIRVLKCDCFKSHHGTASDPADRHHPKCRVHDG